MDCIFCKIVSKDIKADIIYEDENVVAFRDQSPVAPVHFLVIPRIHIACVDDINDSNKFLISNIFGSIPKIAEKEGIGGKYRIVNNCGELAGQTVFHMHFHVIGGREFGWPPG